MSSIRRCARIGFTLIEMVVVLAIVGTLAMLVGPSVFRNVGDAQRVAARSQIETLAVALEAYRLDVGTYPSSAAGLGVLRSNDSSATGWRGPYLRKLVPRDPWGRPYVYRSPGMVNPQSYDLFSYGRDGAPGGGNDDADITSWGEDQAR